MMTAAGRMGAEASFPALQSDAAGLGLSEEQQLRLALEAMPHALCMFDAGQRLVFANRNFARIYGFRAESLSPGTTADSVLRRRALTGGLGAQAPLAWLRSIQNRLLTEGHADLEVEIDDGRVLAIRHRPVPGGGWVETHIDVTARARAERALEQMRVSLQRSQEEAERRAAEVRVAHDRLRAAFDAVPEGLVLLDADDRYLLWNSRYAESFVQPEDALVPGMSFESMLRAGLARGEYPDAIGREAEWLAARMARHGLPRNSHEQSLPNGRWVRVEEKRTSDGGSIGVRIDITESKRREASFKLLFDANPLPMLLIEREGLAVLAVNDAAIALYGHDRDAFRSLAYPAVLPEAEAAAAADFLADPGNSMWAGRVWTHVRADRSTLQARVYATGLAYEGRDAVLLAVLDVSEILHVGKELSRTQSFLDSVVDSIPLSIFVKDMAQGGRYLLFNRAGEQMIGVGRDAIVGRTDQDLLSAEAAEHYGQQDRDVMASCKPVMVEETVASGAREIARVITTRKLPIANPAGGPPRYLLGIQEDVTDRRLIERQLAHMAHHDALTDLPNRLLYESRLRSASTTSGATGADHAVLWIDLDGFKAVNDSLGHAVGDALLLSVGERLRGAVRDTDTVARFGGDEFVILHAPVEVARQSCDLAAWLGDLLREPYHVDGQVVRISASIGIALWSQSNRSPEQLLRNADIALYRAKASGRSQYAVFDCEEANEDGGAVEETRRPSTFE